MPLGSLNLSTSKRPADRCDLHAAISVPCALLLLFCGLFGIGPATDYAIELTMQRVRVA
jgi:hypothetical protein